MSRIDFRLRVALFFIVVVIGALLGGCRSRCCVPAPATSARHFLLLRATPLEAGEDGRAQLLLEAAIVSAPGHPDVPRMLRATAMEDSTEIWLTARGPGDMPGEEMGLEILHAPSVVTLAGDEAVVEVCKEGTAGDRWSGFTLRMEAETGTAGTQLGARYEERRDGRPVRHVPSTQLELPPGQTAVIEIRPAP